MPYGQNVRQDIWQDKNQPLFVASSSGHIGNDTYSRGVTITQALSSQVITVLGTGTQVALEDVNVVQSYVAQPGQGSGNCSESDLSHTFLFSTH